MSNTEAIPRKTWFTLSREEYKPISVSEHAPLYRIIPFDSLLQMINEGTNVLVHTKKWEDKYESFLVKERFIRDGNEIPV